MGVFTSKFKDTNAEVIAEPVLKISERLNLPLIATNDCRFENESMSRPHDTLICIGTGHKFSDVHRPRYSKIIILEPHMK